MKGIHANVSTPTLTVFRWIEYIRKLGMIWSFPPRFSLCIPSDCTWLHQIAMQHFIFSHLQPSSAIFMLWESAMSAMSAMLRPDDMRWMPATSPAGCYWANGRWSRSEPWPSDHPYSIRSQKIHEDPWEHSAWEHHGWNTFLEYVGKRGGEQMWTVSTCLYFEHLWAFAYRHPEPLSLPSDVEVTDSHWDFWVMGERWSDPPNFPLIFIFFSFFFWHSHPFSSVRSSATVARRIWSAFAWPAVPMCSFSEERADIRADALPVIGYHWVSLGMLYSCNMLQYILYSSYV